MSKYRRVRTLYPEKYGKMCLIFPDDPFKGRWDILVMVALLFVCFITPYRIAFVEKDNVEWVIIDCGIDLLFLTDLILTFFMAYNDENTYEIVTDRKKIACRYLRFWFLVDLLAVVPISLFLNTNDYNSGARLLKLPKLYRLIKMTRLVRMLKIVKERSKLTKYLSDILKIGAGFERLLFFVLLSLVVVHCIACVWVI